MFKFISFILFNYVSYMLMTVVLIYGVNKVFHVSHERAVVIRGITLFPFVLSLLFTSISFIDIWNQRYISLMLAILMAPLGEIILLIWLKRFTKSENYRMPLLMLTFINCLFNVAEMLQQYLYLLNEEWFLKMPNSLDFLLSLVWNLPFFLLAIGIFKIVPLAIGFQRLLDFPTFIYIGCGLFYLADYLMITMNIEAIRNPLMKHLSLYVSGSFLFLLVVLILSLREIDRNFNFKYSKKLLIEQQTYVAHVESLYNDLQSIQHDYKNLLSGMYLQVSEGKIEEVKKYLSKNLLSVDEALQYSLKQQRQLGKIELIEVKSLLLTKMIMAKSHKVTFNLEVTTAIRALSMETKDFLRILGIAVDNAIEAAKDVIDNPMIDVLLMQDNNYVEVVVKNPYAETIDHEKIWQVGYSTKGEKRGLGLSNYLKILDSYGDVLRETQISENQFTHTILIPVKEAI